MDLALGLLDVGHMMQDAMAEHHVKGVIGERQAENTALPQLLVGKLSQRQPGPDSLNGLGGQVDPGPVGPLAYQTLRVGSLPQSDLEHLLAGHVQGVDAGQQVALVLVAEAIIVREEFFIIVVEALVKPTDLGIATRVILPESLNGSLVH